jgi:DNA replication protein DnaC
LSRLTEPVYLSVGYRSIFDLVRDFMKDEAFNQMDKKVRKYLKPDLVIIDDMGLKQLQNTPANTCWKSSCVATKTVPPS